MFRRNKNKPEKPTKQRDDDPFGLNFDPSAMKFDDAALENELAAMLGNDESDEEPVQRRRPAPTKVRTIY